VEIIASTGLFSVTGVARCIRYYANPGSSTTPYLIEKSSFRDRCGRFPSISNKNLNKSPKRQREKAKKQNPRKIKQN
jgi:hypothetical protein